MRYQATFHGSVYQYPFVICNLLIDPKFGGSIDNYEPSHMFSTLNSSFSCLAILCLTNNKGEEEQRICIKFPQVANSF